MLVNDVSNKSKKVFELESIVNKISANKPCEKCDDSPLRRDCLKEHDGHTLKVR